MGPPSNPPPSGLGLTCGKSGKWRFFLRCLTAPPHQSSKTCRFAFPLYCRMRGRRERCASHLPRTALGPTLCSHHQNPVDNLPPTAARAPFWFPSRLTQGLFPFWIQQQKPSPTITHPVGTRRKTPHDSSPPLKTMMYLLIPGQNLLGQVEFGAPGGS